MSLIGAQIEERLLPGAVGVDFVIIVVAYIYLRSGATQAGLYTLLQGLFLDIYSGGFEGLFVFLYLFVLGVINVSSRIIHLDNPRGQILVVGMAWLSKGLLFILILMVLGQGFVLDNFRPWHFAGAIVGTSFSAPIVFYLLDKLRLFIIRPGHREALFEES